MKETLLDTNPIQPENVGANISNLIHIPPSSVAPVAVLRPVAVRRGEPTALELKLSPKGRPFRSQVDSGRRGVRAGAVR